MVALIFDLEGRTDEDLNWDEGGAMVELLEHLDSRQSDIELNAKR